MQEVHVARVDLDETLKRLARDGNQIRGVVDSENVGEVVVRFESRTEIREDV